MNVLGSRSPIVFVCCDGFGGGVEPGYGVDGLFGYSQNGLLPIPGPAGNGAGDGEPGST